jgi:hypothetical protein
VTTGKGRKSAKSTGRNAAELQRGREAREQSSGLSRSAGGLCCVLDERYAHSTRASPCLGIIEERRKRSTNSGSDHPLPALPAHTDWHTLHDNKFALHPDLLNDAAPPHLLPAHMACSIVVHTKISSVALASLSRIAPMTLTVRPRCKTLALEVLTAQRSWQGRGTAHRATERVSREW